MQAALFGAPGEIGLDRDARNPCQPLACEHKRPPVAFFARHARVDEDVLDLASSSAADRTHPQPGPAEPQVEVQPGRR